MTDYEGFHVEIDAARKVATITLDVPGKMNRVAITARAQLAQVFEELGRDEAVRCIVIRGAGDEAFTAGMGADAIRDLLRQIDIERLAEDLRREMRDATSEAKRKKIAKIGRAHV